MKQYKGIIFNSVKIGLLKGELGRVVSANNIRTAVVSRKTRTACKKFMKARGISVEVIIGGQMATIQEDLDNMKNKSIEESAKDNNGVAMLLLAQDYLSKGDKASAMEWAQRAEMNLVFGVYGFEGFLHLTSDEEGESHLERAKECFKLDVSAADPISMRYLGYMYKFGVGVEKDLKLSDDLLKCAIAIGDEVAEKILNIKNG